MWCYQRPACCCVCDLVDVLVDVPTVLRWSELDGNWIGAIIPCSELFRWVNYPDFCVLACCSPHLCVGFLFLILYPAAASLLRLLRRRSSLSQKTLSPTIFHTQLCQPQLFHTPSFTHNFVTHNFVTHHLSHITLSHKTLSIITFSPHLCTWRHPLSLCVAGVALMALGWLWWRAWARLVARGAAPLCVAGVALGDIHLRFAWQAWHLATSTFTLHGRRGTYGTGLALVARLGAVSRPRVAGVALGDIRFAWQVWHWVTWFTTTNLSYRFPIFWNFRHRLVRCYW